MKKYQIILLHIRKKAEQLEEDTFKVYGYFIPLKFYIGGSFKINTENMSKREIKQLLYNINAGLKMKLVNFEKEFGKNLDFNNDR